MAYITVKQASEILGYSTVYTAKLLRQKRIAGQKMNATQWIVNRESVLEFKRQREIERHQQKLIK